MDYFSSMEYADTLLAVNSCARGAAVAESDLDLAILLKPGTSPKERIQAEEHWHTWSGKDSRIVNYLQSNQFAQLHFDFIDGNYSPSLIEPGGQPDSFELEIGNQIAYSAPLTVAGPYFQELRNKWLPYYPDELRIGRQKMVKEACLFDLDHIPFFHRRGLYFHAFDVLCNAFKKYLQALFITEGVYPLAYNKWIREQVVNWLGRSALYKQLPPILSIPDIESADLIERSEMLRILLMELETDNAETGPHTG